MTGSFGDSQMHESIFCISFPAEAKTKVLAERLLIRIKTLCKFNPIFIRSRMKLAGEKGGAWGRGKHLKWNVKQEVARDGAVTQKSVIAKLKSL